MEHLVKRQLFYPNSNNHSLLLNVLNPQVGDVQVVLSEGLLLLSQMLPEPSVDGRSKPIQLLANQASGGKSQELRANSSSQYFELNKFDSFEEQPYQQKSAFI